MKDIFPSYPAKQMGPIYFNLHSGANGFMPPRVELMQTSNGEVAKLLMVAMLQMEGVLRKWYNSRLMHLILVQVLNRHSRLIKLLLR